MNEILEIKRKMRPPIPRFADILQENEIVKKAIADEGADGSENQIRQLAKFESEVIDSGKELVKTCEEENQDNSRL